MSFLGLWRRLGRPEIRTTATFPEWKNTFSLHLATIFDEKSAWETAIYEISAFVTTRKPRILRMNFDFSEELLGQMRKHVRFPLKTFALIRKTCFRGVKTRVLGTLISLRIKKNRQTCALARVFWAPKRAQKHPKRPKPAKWPKSGAGARKTSPKKVDFLWDFGG